MLRIAGGDASALETLYDRYVRQCFGLALRMLSDKALAEEVVQEVFLKVWTQPNSYSPQRGRFASWILSLVHHRSIDELRKYSHGELPLDDPALGGVLNTEADPEPDPADQVWLAEQQKAVREALKQIAPNQRQVLELAYFRGLSQSEIASKLDQPLGTVKTRMRSGMQSLRSLLESQRLITE